MVFSPLANVERRYQDRVMRPARGWGRWIIRGVYLLALQVALILYFGELAGAILWRDASPIMEWLGSLNIMLLVIAFTAHLSLMLRIMTSASDSIAREETSGTWDLLVLTGVDARQIVLAKWWGILRHYRRDLLLLIPLRAGAAALLGALLGETIDGGIFITGGQVVPPPAINLLLVVPLLIVFTFLGAGLAAAFGMAASALIRRPGVANAVALLTMIVFLIVIWMACLVGLRALETPYDPNNPAAYDRATIARSVLDMVQGTPLDNGTFLTANLVIHPLQYPDNYPGPYADPGYMANESQRIAVSYTLALLSALALLALPAAAALRLAQHFAMRAGALSPEQRRKGS